MRSRLYKIIWLLPLLFLGEVNAKSVDCRVIVGNITQCNPYTQRFLKAKEQIDYDLSQKKLIVDKTLPLPRKPHVKVVSVADMIERYVQVDESMRFKGTDDKAYFKSLKHRKKETKTLPFGEKKTVLKDFDKNLTHDTAARPKHTLSEPEIYSPKVDINGTYKVHKGDVLSKIAQMFGLKTKELMKMNKLSKKDTLHIGQVLKIPLSKEKTDAIIKGEYKIKKYDSLIGIAKYFGITPKALADANHIKKSADIYPGRVLDLPLPYKLAEEKKYQKKKHLIKKKKRQKTKLIRSFGKRKLRVTATAYTSHGEQTDSTPFLAAWNNRLRPGMKIIAVSRDLLYRYGMKNGTKVKIAGLPGYYHVRDKMNKRYKRRIDIYMGTNRKKALRWGRRSVVIYW